MRNIGKIKEDKPKETITPRRMRNIGKIKEDKPKPNKWKWGKAEKELIKYFKQKYGDKD
jgi:hypothetical protein